ncbi:MAG: cyclic nucleotide-binding/CBS domain-containing protein [Candidatus Heimdallarchaeota archaeon]
MADRMPLIEEIHADLPVSDVMSRDLIMIRFDASIGKAARLMTQHQIGTLIVVDEEGRIFGVLTERDLLTRGILQNRDLKTYPVGRVASKPVVSVTRDTSTYQAMMLMNTKKIRRLVVVENGIPVGILTVSDVLRIVPELVDILQELIHLHWNNNITQFNEGETILTGGYCEICGEWSDVLTIYTSFALCPTCIEERI